ncbi:uncharacterized protein METZ01_LOCUS479251, partial [marine metagenome]
EPATADGTDFGSADIDGVTATSTYTIYNTGNAALSLTGNPIVGKTGDHSADFTVTPPSTSTVGVGDSVTFIVVFNPSATGTRSAILSVPNDDTNENPYNFSIQGTGTDAEIRIEGKSTEISDGDDEPATADGTDFGSVDIDGITATSTFTIYNSGSTALTLTGSPRGGKSGDHPSDFAVTGPVASTVNAGGNITFVVVFNASDTGTRSAILSVPNDDPDENPYNFSIQGKGTAVLTATGITVT